MNDFPGFKPVKVKQRKNWLGTVHKASVPNMLLALVIGLVLATVIAWIGLQLGVSDSVLTIGLTVLWPVLYGMIVSRRSASPKSAVPPDNKGNVDATDGQFATTVAPLPATPAVVVPEPVAVAAAPTAQKVDEPEAIDATAAISSESEEEAELQAQLALLNQLVRQNRQAVDPNKDSPR